MSSKVERVIPILFALSLVVFGLNKFLYLIPTPPLEVTAAEWMHINVASGLMKIIGGLALIPGIGSAKGALIIFLLNLYFRKSNFSNLLNELSGDTTTFNISNQKTL